MELVLQERSLFVPLQTHHSLVHFETLADSAYGYGVLQNSQPNLFDSSIPPNR